VGQMPKANPLQFFRTPASVADQMIDLAGIDALPAGTKVLEPSAGDGAITFRVISRTHGTIKPLSIELDKDRSEKIRWAWGSGPVETANFLNWSAPCQFDRVLMNPPFVSGEDPQAYQSHIRRAFSMLRPGGRLVSVAPSGFTFRTDAKATAFRDWVEDFGTWTDLPADSFEGTGVQTVLIVLDRPNDATPGDVRKMSREFEAIASIPETAATPEVASDLPSCPDLERILSVELPVFRDNIRRQPRIERSTAIRKLFKDLGLKSINVTTPNHSMASSTDIRIHRDFHEHAPHADFSTCPRCQRRQKAIQRIHEIILAAFPDMQDRSDHQSDYFNYAFSVD